MNEWERKMEAREMEEALKVLDSSLSQIKWRLKFPAKRRLQLGQFLLPFFFPLNFSLFQFLGGFLISSFWQPPFHFMVYSNFATHHANGFWMLILAYLRFPSLESICCRTSSFISYKFLSVHSSLDHGMFDGADVLALCTGMRPVVMIDYGGKMPELQQRLCALLKLIQTVYYLLIVCILCWIMNYVAYCLYINRLGSSLNQ